MDKKPVAKVIATKMGKGSYKVDVVYNENDDVKDLHGLFDHIALTAMEQTKKFENEKEEN